MTYDPTQRTDYGYPAAAEDPAYLPREQAQLQDSPMLIEMYEHESFLPGWALWAGVVLMVCMFFLALVAA